MSHFIVELEEAEGQQIAQQAAERGYASVVDYLRALVAADALAAALRDDWREADEPAEVIEAGFREAWYDAMTAKTYPLEQLWDMLEGDE